MQRFRYKQVVPFLVALLLPNIVIAVLAWSNAKQERQIAEKERGERAQEAEDRAVVAVRQETLNLLEGIKFKEIAAASVAPGLRTTPYADAAVALTGWAEGNRLVLPWDADPGVEWARQYAGAPEFARKEDEASHAEFGEKRDDRAAELYRAAIAAAEAANAPSLGAWARLQLARVLARSGSRSEALVLYRGLLSLPSTVVDDPGIPIWSYAIKPMLNLDGTPGADRAVLDRTASELDSSTVTPHWSQVLRSGLEALRTPSDAAAREKAGALARLQEREEFLDRAEALKAAYKTLPVTAADWQLWGDPAWLIGMTQARPDSQPLVIAVRAADIFSRIESGNVASLSGLQFQLAADGDSVKALGQNLEGLRVTFKSSEHIPVPSPQRSFYFLALLLINGVTFFSGYLLWRDTRRESRMAEMRSQFVSSVSHELKTPLTSIRMFAETLQMDAPPEPRVRAEYMDTIVNETERLTRLINDVLDFSKIERGQRNYHLQNTSLVEVVDVVTRTMQFPLAQQGFALRVTVGEGIPSMTVDRDAIEQAILNLLNNAMKYSGQSRAIDLRLFAENGNVLIQVSDRGIGIPIAEQRRIFEKFYRVMTPENRAISGTGIGLSLVGHVAEAHGGGVEVRSKPGEGSTFSIRLPLPAVAAGGLS